MISFCICIFILKKGGSFWCGKNHEKVIPILSKRYTNSILKGDALNAANHIWMFFFFLISKKKKTYSILLFVTFIIEDVQTLPHIYIYIYIYICLFVNHVEVIKKKLNMLHWFGTLFFCQFPTKCNIEYKFKRVHATIIMSNNNIRRFFFCLFADNKRVFYTLVIAEIIITDNHITIFLYWRHTYIPNEIKEAQLYKQSDKL